MGNIWLQRADGRLIHMPVVGADVNSSEDAVKIPVGVLTNPERCRDGTVEIVSPTHGSITFDFDVPGRTGSCNQCGSCCTHPVSACMNPGGCGYILDTNYDVHKCQYLSISPGAKKLGKAGNTECSIRATILDVAKGCALEPSSTSAMYPHMTACGFTFSG